MKVYVVLEGEDYEGSRILEISKNLEKANEVLLKYMSEYLEKAVAWNYDANPRLITDNDGTYYGEYGSSSWNIEIWDVN